MISIILPHFTIIIYKTGLNKINNKAKKHYKKMCEKSLFDQRKICLKFKS